MEGVFHQTEQESFKKLLLPSGRQKRVVLILAECCGSNYRETRTYRNGSADLVPQNLEYSRTIQFHWESCICKSWGRFKQGSRLQRSSYNCHAGTKPRKILFNDSPLLPSPTPPSRVEVLPYMGSIGMYGLKGYSFSPVLVINRVSILVDFGHFGHK